MNETGNKLSKRDILFPLGEKVSMNVSYDLAKGANYETLMAIKEELEEVNIIVSITTGGINFSVNSESYDAAKSILDERGLEMSESDIRRHDANSISNNTKNKN